MELDTIKLKTNGSPHDAHITVGDKEVFPINRIEIVVDANTMEHKAVLFMDYTSLDLDLTDAQIELHEKLTDVHPLRYMFVGAVLALSFVLPWML